MECSIDVFYVNKRMRKARWVTSAQTLDKLAAEQWFKFLLGYEEAKSAAPAVAVDAAAAQSADDMCCAVRVSFYGLTDDDRRALCVTKELLSIIAWGTVSVRVFI